MSFPDQLQSSGLHMEAVYTQMLLERQQQHLLHLALAQNWGSPNFLETFFQLLKWYLKALQMSFLQHP
jgi:hypothetical protein